ncbi:MAG: Wzz/FepE/Etk N-terminal domain-containing protein, partial [Candidatus Azotimanducaceae bacterium]
MENEATAASTRPEYDDEIDLRELFVALWASKTTIIGIVLISALLSVFVALSLPNKYTSQALLAPRSDSVAGGSLGQMASQFGGLASLAGVNIGGLGDQGSTAVAIEMLKSRQFFGTYLYDVFLIDLMAAEGWDRGTGKVLIDDSLFDVKTATWVRDVSEEFQVKPSVQEAHELFSKEFLSVAEDTKSGFVTVEVTHYSPTVARDWVALVVKGVNEAVRARDVEEAEKSIAFLNQQRVETNLVSLTEVFAELIEQQTKTVMLANASDEYVFQVIEPPVAPELKSEPKRALICVLGTLLGGMLAVLFALIRHYTVKRTA